MSLTGILGKYISEIPAGTVGLSAVPVSRYERIFKVHTQAPANPLGNPLTRCQQNSHLQLFHINCIKI